MSIHDLSGRPISRRDANRLLIGAAGLAAAGPLTALAQTVQRPTGAPNPAAPQGTPPSPPVPTGPSFLDGVIKRAREREYTFKAMVVIDGYQTPVTHIQPGVQVNIIELEFKSAAIVFPVLRGTATSQTHVDHVKGIMSFDDKPEDTTPTCNDGYHSGTRLCRWELRDKKGRQASLQVEIPMTVWETVFDEAAAMAAPWPKAGWGEIGTTTFERQLFVDRDDPVMTNAVQQWCGGNDPKSIPPAKLAKFLAGKVLENVQPSGTGLVASRVGAFAGMDLRGAAVTLESGRGNEHEIACVLAGIYRNAGLPARTVIGYDMSETRGQDATVFDRVKSGGNDLRSWVEFSLYDEINQKEIWIPVDIVRMRKSSSRAQPLDKPWKYFGYNEDTEDIMPFAFQYHPPTSVVAHGAVAFWGWLTVPQTQAASQWLDFNAMRSPNRGGKDGR